MNTVEIALSSGKVAVIDAEDLPKVSVLKWHESTRGYAVAYTGSTNTRKAIYMHRLVLENTAIIDHCDLNKLNNRKSNLRAATASESARHRAKTRTQTTSQFKGVCWYKAYSKWKAYLWCKQLRLHLGYFNDEVAAARAYNHAALKHFGQFAKLNPV